MDFYDSEAYLTHALKTEYGRFVKEGSILPKDEVAKLPDRLFALVMEKDGQVLRKYACPDKSNTALSLAYFDNYWKGLPISAAKTAAVNLSTACKWYHIPEPEHLQKVAFLGNVALTAGIMKSMAPEMKRKGMSKANLSLLKAGLPPKLPKVGSSSLQPYVKVKQGELTFSEEYDLIKAAEIQPGVKLAFVGDVFKAVELFEKRAHAWEGKERAAYCRPLVKRAAELGLLEKMPYKVRVYGNIKVASDDHVMAYLETRKDALGKKGYRKYAQAVLDRTDGCASEEYAEKIAEVDQEFEIGYHSNMPDPWEIIHGQYKKASYVFNDNDRKITEKDLKMLAENTDELGGVFSDDIIESFRKEPVRIFESLPLDHKRVFINTIQRIKLER